MTWFRAGGGGIPASLKNGMNAVLNKKFGTSGQTYAPSDWPDDVNLLGKLPEKTVSGAIANITDGADEVPLKKLIFSASPVQAAGTPSPSNPLPISGHMEMNGVHTGKNLITAPEYTATSSTLCLDLGRNITFSSVMLSFLATNTVVNATNAAIVDFREEDGTHHYLTLAMFYNENNVQFTANTPQNGRYRRASSNIKFRYVYVFYMSNNFSYFTSDSVTEWQLEIGTAVTSFVPYSAETKKWTFPPFGKNQWNEEWEVGSLTSAGTDYASTTRIRSIGYIPIEEETEYYINSAGYTADIHFYDENKTHLSSVQKTNTTFTTPSDARFIRFCMAVGYGTTYNNDIAINYPATATAYEPYQSMFSGSVNALTGDVERNMRMVILSESQIDNASEYTYQSKNGVQISNAFPENVIRTETHQSSHDVVQKGASSDSHYMWFGSSSGNKYLYWIGILDELNMTLAQWKEWAKSQTIQLLYTMPTPTSLDMDSVDWQTQLGDNNFYNDCGDTSVTYRADIDLALAQSSGTRGLMMASRSVSPMIGEEASLDRENILEEVSENLDNEESEEER